MKLAGASPEEIRYAAHLVAGLGVLIREGLLDEEPNFPEVCHHLWRMREALEQLENTLRWHLEDDAHPLA